MKHNMCRRNIYRLRHLVIEIETIAGRGHVKIRCVCDCAVGCHKGMIIAGNKTKKKSIYIRCFTLLGVEICCAKDV